MQHANRTLSVVTTEKPDAGQATAVRDNLVGSAWQRYNDKRRRMWERLAYAGADTQLFVYNRGDAHLLALAAEDCPRKREVNWRPHWYHWTGGASPVAWYGFIAAHAGRLRMIRYQGQLAQALVATEITDLWLAAGVEGVLDSASRTLGAAGNSGDLRGELALAALDALEKWGPRAFGENLYVDMGLHAQFTRYLWATLRRRAQNFKRANRCFVPYNDLVAYATGTSKGVEIRQPTPRGHGIVIDVEYADTVPDAAAVPTPPPYLSLRTEEGRAALRAVLTGADPRPVWRSRWL